MENILIIGATGQIGSELTMELRRRYGNNHVVAGYIIGSEPKGELKESGPSEVVDVTDGEMVASVVKKYHIDAIYNLAALLSVVAESKPKLAWKIGIDGLWNVLEVARENGCSFPWAHFQYYSSWWRYYRLCRGYLLFGRSRREVRLPYQAGDSYGYDVYAGCFECCD